MSNEKLKKQLRQQENARFLKIYGGSFKKELMDLDRAEGARLTNVISKERADIKGLIHMGSTKKKFALIESSSST